MRQNWKEQTSNINRWTRRLELLVLSVMLASGTGWTTEISADISDAAWTQFRQWVEYFGKVFGVATVAVPPHHTSQNCSNCGEVVKKSLSTRTHVCPHCGHTQDRDWNAARNILELGLRTVGHTGSQVSGDIDLCLGGEIPPNKPSRGKRKPKK